MNLFYQKILEQLIKEKVVNKYLISLQIRHTVANFSKLYPNRTWKNKQFTLEKILNIIQELIKEKQGKECVVHLSTDSDWVQDFFKLKLNNLLILDKVFLDTEKEFSLTFSLQNTQSTLLDMFLMAKSDTLVCIGDSWFHFYPRLMVKGDILLIQPDSLGSNNIASP